MFRKSWQSFAAFVEVWDILSCVLQGFQVRSQLIHYNGVVTVDCINIYSSWSMK